MFLQRAGDVFQDSAHPSLRCPCPAPLIITTRLATLMLSMMPAISSGSYQMPILTPPAADGLGRRLTVSSVIAMRLRRARIQSNIRWYNSSRAAA